MKRILKRSCPLPPFYSTHNGIPVWTPSELWRNWGIHRGRLSDASDGTRRYYLGPADYFGVLSSHDRQCSVIWERTKSKKDRRACGQGTLFEDATYMLPTDTRFRGPAIPSAWDPLPAWREQQKKLLDALLQGEATVQYFTKPPTRSPTQDRVRRKLQRRGEPIAGPNVQLGQFPDDEDKPRRLIKRRTIKRRG